MTQCDKTARDNTIVSRDCAVEKVRSILRNAIIIEGRFTVAQLAARTGIKPRRLESYMSETEDREAPLSAALSIMEVLGDPAVNGVLSTIGYVAQRVSSTGQMSPAQDAVAAMESVTKFARCALDNHIDHIEKPIATEAADNVIELMVPYSSRRK